MPLVSGSLFKTPSTSKGSGHRTKAGVKGDSNGKGHRYSGSAPEPFPIFLFTGKGGFLPNGTGSVSVRMISPFNRPSSKSGSSAAGKGTGSLNGLHGKRGFSEKLVFSDGDVFMKVSGASGSSGHGRYWHEYPLSLFSFSQMSSFSVFVVPFYQEFYMDALAEGVVSARVARAVSSKGQPSRAKGRLGDNRGTANPQEEKGKPVGSAAIQKLVPKVLRSSKIEIVDVTISLGILGKRLPSQMLPIVKLLTSSSLGKTMTMKVWFLPATDEVLGYSALFSLSSAQIRSASHGKGSETGMDGFTVIAVTLPAKRPKKIVVPSGPDVIRVPKGAVKRYES